MSSVKTWTNHKLTNNMLRQLSAIQKTPFGAHGYGAPAGRSALFSRGLIEALETNEFGDAMYNKGWKTTHEGDTALREARHEGW